MKCCKKIKILDVNNVILYNGQIEDMPIDENIIKQLSIEYYDNKEPCMIIKSSILSMIYSDFHAFFEKIGYSTPIKANSLPERLLKYVQVK